MSNFETYQNQERREDPDIEKYLDIIIARGELAERPDPRDFEDVWDAEKIERDTAYVEKMRSKMEEHDDVIEKKAKALEVLAAYYIEHMGWLGEGGHATRTSEYDDIAHGIDMVTEFEGKTEDRVDRLGLAVDAYSGKSLTNLSKKAERFVKAVKGEINTATGQPYAETVARVDYFESRVAGEDGSRYRGSLSKLPPVAVALSGFNGSDMFKTTADIMKAENIAGALLQRKKRGESLTPVEDEMLLKNMEKLQELKTAAREHPAQQLFIRQIAKQLEVYMEVGNETEGADREFLENIERAHRIIKALENPDVELEDLQEDLDKLEAIFGKIK